MKMTRHNNKQWVLRLSAGPCILLISLGSLTAIGEAAIAHPLQVSQQSDANPIKPSAAQSAFDEGVRLFKAGTAASQQQSIAKFQDAAAGFEQMGNRARAALALNNLGFVYSAIGDKPNALTYFAKALPLWRAEGDQAGEARTLKNIGVAYNALGEKQKALDFFTQALPLWEALGDPAGEANILAYIANAYDGLGEKQKALAYYIQALTLERKLGDRSSEATTLNNIGFVYDALGEKQKALDYYTQALSLQKVLGNRSQEATTLKNIGSVYSDLGEKQKALDYYAQALTIQRAMGDRDSESSTLTYIGGVYVALGKNQQALDTFSQALSISKIVGNRAREATALSSLGSIYTDLGETQKALNAFVQALPLRKAVNDRNGEAITLSNMGGLYSALGEKQKALDYYTQALSIVKALKDRDSEATILNNMGLVYDALGQNQKALDYYVQSLLILKVVGDRAREGRTLSNIGAVYKTLGNQQKALDYYAQALPILKAVGDRKGEASALNNLGTVYDDLGQKQKALDAYVQSMPLLKALGDRNREAGTLNNIATVYQEQGKLTQALEQVNLAIAIVENLRTKINSQDLRASYFATVQDYYQLKTELLMQLHQQSPEKGYDKQALETSDRSRARGLIELLAEAGITLQTTTESNPVITQEQQLQQALRQLEQQRVVLLSAEHTPTQAEALDKQSDALVNQLQDLTTRLRTTNPAYANLKYPQPLSTSQIQQQVVDSDTVLLQYALGETQSYLWTVTPNGIKSYTLPGRTAIEAAVKPFQSVISNAGNTVSDAKRTGDALYQIILAPAADQLQGKRLLVVADGALQFIPFGALPLPHQSSYIPLMKDHEIINAPSASSVAILRQQAFPVAPKTLAIFADPVFSADDGRMTGKDNPTLDSCAPAPQSTQPKGIKAQKLPLDLQRNLRDLDLRGIQRLPNTRIEAERILALVPPNQRSAACAFTANYDQVTQANRKPLNQYRIVHFATHGFINNNRPQYSGLVLSLVDPQGKPRDGFLRLRDIFNLKLSADLVVLSACQTGLGKNIRGEGIVGLTRGFMYAGSKRVVTSLWSVDDAATAQLMGHFYRGMLKEKQTPAVALRNAQLQMWKSNPDPRLWAAFTLQGEWRP